MNDKMPEMTEEAVAEWTVEAYYGPGVISPSTVKAWGALERQRALARAVLALVAAKVREAVTLARKDEVVDATLRIRGWSYTPKQIVSRVLGRDGGAR